MAFTATLKKVSVHGDQRVAQYDVTADAVSGVVATKVGVIESAFISPISMATAAGKVKINAKTATSAQNGSVNIADVASGDNFFLIVYGRS